MAKEVREKYMQTLENADVRELAIHRRVSRMNYSRRCAEASAVKAYQKRGLPMAPGMEIGLIIYNV
jgi:DNA polymerase I